MASLVSYDISSESEDDQDGISSETAYYDHMDDISSENDNDDSTVNSSSVSGKEVKIRKKRNRWTTMKKLMVIDYAEKHGNRATGRYYKIDRKCVRDWRQAKSKLEEMKEKGGALRKRADGSGRKVALPILEELLIVWLQMERSEKRRVTRKLVFLKAKEIFLEKQQQGEIAIDFKFSNGWLYRFMHRHNLTLRRKTTSCQKPPSDYLEKLVNFVIFVRQQREMKKYPLASIFACDETAVWLDSISNTTIDVRGTKEVSVRSTGHEKQRITVMLTARADGSKIKPYVLLDRKRHMKELDKFSSKLYLEYAGKSWMDDDLISKYLNKALGRSLFGGRRLLVWDSFSAHISKKTKDELKQLQIDMAVIPGGCTKFIQAPDVCWNKPFKERIREYYDIWMANGEKLFTAAGNAKAPSLPTVCQWIIGAWESLDKDMIVNSFKVCGISNAIDGSWFLVIECYLKDYRQKLTFIQS